MKARRPPRAPDPSPPLPDPATVDRLYGLEPVFEPADQAAAGADGGGLLSLDVACPFCGEPFETVIDTSAGSARYVEDCEICCRPIEFVLEVDHAGELESLGLLRGD